MSRPKGIPKTGGRVKGSVNKATMALRARLLRDEQLTVQATIEAIRRGQQYDARALFDAKGNLRPIHTLTEAEAWCIAGFEVVIKNAAAGDGHTDTIHKVKLIDRGRYVELAAKHQGMLVERVEIGLEWAPFERLLAGRQRAAGLLPEAVVEMALIEPAQPVDTSAPSVDRAKNTHVYCARADDSRERRDSSTVAPDRGRRVPNHHGSPR